MTDPTPSPLGLVDGRLSLEEEGRLRELLALSVRRPLPWKRTGGFDDYPCVELVNADGFTGRPGQEDLDLMGVCIEPVASVLGLGRFDQWQWRSQPEGVRSGPGDIDITVYGLRKYLHLATKGNPSILQLLFVPPEKVHLQTEWGERLQALAPKVVSRQVGAPFLGYCKAQRERLEGVRGGMHTNRPELIGEHGYDTKYAMHALRLAHQGIEVLSTGRLTLPMPPDPGDYLRAVRRGEVPFDDFMVALNRAETALKTLTELHNDVVPEHPDLDAVEAFMAEARLANWGRGETT